MQMARLRTGSYDLHMYTRHTAEVAPLRVGTQTDTLGESPIWGDRAQCLYGVEIRRPAIRRLHPVRGRIDRWAMPDLMASIALTDEDRLLVALFDGVSGRLEAFARTPEVVPGHRFNDGWA